MALSYPDGLYQYVLAMCVIHPTNIWSAYYYSTPSSPCGRWGCTIMGLTLFGTSVNFWRYPQINSWRRKLDMWVAHPIVGWHIYLSIFRTTRPLLCGSLMVSGALMYPLSLYVNQKLGALCHCLLHLLVSFGASTTYAHFIDKQ